jgi:hypothetical protein
VKRAAGHIVRHYDDERVGDTDCMDVWEIDGYFYDDEDHRIVYNWGAHNPVLQLAVIIDGRSTCIKGFEITTQPERGVLDLAERVVRSPDYWLAERAVCDRAGNYRRLVRGRLVMHKTGELAEAMRGPLGLLGMQGRGSEEHNPRANRIERVIGIFADKARRDFGNSWRPPKRVRGYNGDMRRKIGIDERVRWHLNEHRQGQPTGLLPLSEVKVKIAAWIPEINSAETDAKGCHGMTRQGAFNYAPFRPSLEEIARRTPPRALIDWAFAERFEGKNARCVRDDGSITLPDGCRYFSRDFSTHLGQVIDILRYRRDHSQIFWKLPGSRDVMPVELRVPIGTAEPQRLALAIAAMKADRRFIAREMPAAATVPPWRESVEDIAGEMARLEAGQ